MISPTRNVLLVNLILIAFLFGLGNASAGPRDCEPGQTKFTLTSTGGVFIWQGIRLSIGHFADTALRYGGRHPQGYMGEPLPARASLLIAELENVSAQDTPSLVRTGKIHLASNVAAFTRVLSINFGDVDVADLSFCFYQQVNLHCGNIAYYASENAFGMKCSLVIFDPAQVVTP